MSTTQNRVSLRSYRPRPEGHRHPHHQLVLPLAGRLELSTNLGTGVVGDRQAAVITAGRIHTFRSHEDNRFLVVDVLSPDTETTSDLWKTAANQPFIDLDEGLLALLQFVRSCQEPSPSDIQSSLATLILHGLAHTTAPAVPQAPPEPQALQRATAFIHRFYAHSLTTQDVAVAAQVSVATLNRLFNRWHGCATGRYLRRVRLARAHVLLQDSYMPIAEIALDCGFSEQSALTRALRQETGMTPAQIRSASRRR